MKRITSALTIIALMGSSTAYAAQDMGLTLHNGTRASAPHSGIGAQASVTIRLGDHAVVRDAEKVSLGIAAGPIISVPTRNSIAPERRGVASLAAFTVKPGYSTTLAFAGQPVASLTTRLGAAEDDQQQGKPKRKQSGGDKAAWVGLVAGGVMVALIAAFVISCPTCGSD